MQYKITQQYAKDKESPLAELADFKDAELFISTKLTADEAKGLKLIYRLYKNEGLSQVYNKENIKTSIARAQYEQGDVDLPFKFAEPYSVAGPTINKEEEVIAKFCYLDDAKLFIEAKLSQATHEKNKAYLIYEGKVFIEKIDASGIESKESQGDQGKQQKSSFRPSPLATAPRLGPANWLKTEDEDEGEDKKK